MWLPLLSVFVSGRRAADNVDAAWHARITFVGRMLPPLLSLCHGLQANTFSWAAVQPLLAERLDAVVVSHDMPGFGLTQRSASSSVTAHRQRVSRRMLGQQAMPLHGLQHALLLVVALHVTRSRHEQEVAFRASLRCQRLHQGPLRSWSWQPCRNNPVHAVHRPRSLDAYSLERNGSLGRELLATELGSVSVPVSGASGRSASTLDSKKVVRPATAAQSPAHAPKREQGGDTAGRRRHVLLGHSMGAACAAAEAIENPEVRRILESWAPHVCNGWQSSQGCVDTIFCCAEQHKQTSLLSRASSTSPAMLTAEVL